MDDEDTLREIDRQLKRVLAPSHSTARRIVSASLSSTNARPAWRSATATFAMAASLAGMASAIYVRRPAHSGEITVTGKGSSLIVERQGADRWVFQAEREADSQPSYVIVTSRAGVSK